MAMIYKSKRSYKPKQAKKPRTKSTSKSREGRITKLNPRRGITGFPQELRTTLRYSDVVVLTSTVGSVSTYSFRLNSLYDPDFTGTGHQPYYFDQFAALYQRYCVKGAKITAKFSHIVNAINVTQPSGPTVVGITTDDDGAIATTITTAMEETNTTSDFLNNALGGNNVKTLSKTYSPMTDLGLSETNDSIVSAVNANPTRPWFANVWMAEAGLASPTSVAVKIEIVFDAVFSEIRNIAGS